jgi:hypothetical protein
VHADGSADRDHVEVRALDERLPVGGEVLDAEPPAGLLDRGLPATAERDDLELLDGPEGRDVDQLPPADADDAHSQDHVALLCSAVPSRTLARESARVNDW